MSGRRKKDDSPARRRRPAPPPPPPKALVTLIKKNKSVLTYFTSLQENLEADVRKWKERAKRYQALYEEQLAQNENKRPQEEEEPAAKKRKRSAKSSEEEEEGKEIAKARKKKPHRGEEENGPPTTINILKNPAHQHSDEKKIDDSMFDELPSSSEDEEESTNGRKKKAVQGKKSASSKVAQVSNPRDNSIKDSMFDFDEDEDEEDEEDAVKPAAKKPTKHSKDPPRHKDESGQQPRKGSALDSDEELEAEIAAEADNKAPLFCMQYQPFILSELLDAFNCLKHIGVELVEREEVEQEESPPSAEAKDVGNEQDDDEEEEGGFSFLPDESDTTALKRQLADEASEEEEGSQQRTCTKFQRRSNEDVVEDILNCVRTLTRLQVQHSDLPREYHPFRIPPKWIPCGDRLDDEDAPLFDHPAHVAKICIFRALSVMDTYCGKGCLALSDDPWEHLFDEEGGKDESSSMDPDCKQEIKIGMRDRKEMVENLMQSLYGEISSSWAVDDRADRIKNDSVLYDLGAEAEMESESDEDSNNSQGAGAKKSDLTAYHSKMMAPTGPIRQAHLSQTAERRVLAQLLVNLYLFQKNWQQAFQLICNYVLSAAPSLGLEAYPKLQPALSLVVLEAMLCADKDLVNVGGLDDSHSNDKSVLDADLGHAPNQSCFQPWLNQLRGNPPTQQSSLPRSTLKFCIQGALSLTVHVTALIWRQRLQSNDQKIADSARMEWASYLRLLESQGTWLGTKAVTAEAANEDLDAMLEEQKETSLRLMKDIQHRLNDGASEKGERLEAATAVTASFTLSLLFILNGDLARIKDTWQSNIPELQADASTTLKPSSNFQIVCSACFMGLRQFEILHQSKYRHSIGTPEIIAPAPDAGPGVWSRKASTLCLASLLGYLKAAIGQKQPREEVWKLGETLLDCCSLASDGELAYEALQLLQGFHSSFVDTGKHTITRDDAHCVPKSMIDSLENMVQIPTVRVINLRRRNDRMNLMMSQAIQAGIFVLKGVANLGTNGVQEDRQGEGDHSSGDDGFLFGGYAFDGKTPLDDITAQIYEDEPREGQRLRLLFKKFVARRWRPHDLKAFDRNATNDEHMLVNVSDGERACSLSHIATWKGVVRSLSILDQDATSLPPQLAASGSIRRLALSSGFARGPALDSHNSGMSPSPVCVVLEDDALLADRFADQLKEILEELPRDFHFCSLGYSRPRTAPMVNFSPHLGIPTNLYYLTGYILSPEGAKYLLDSLPVCGPVDTWVGFKLMANWDNRFGTAIGVGNRSTPLVDFGGTRKDLATILRFRAFAALTPLCHQKVGGGGGASTAGVSGHNWRLRDTDIEYSGSANYKSG